MMNIYNIINKYDNFLNGSKRNSCIQLLDNEYIVIECCKGIKEFDENKIKLNLARCDIVIIGLELKMSNFNKYGVKIRGKIHSINFE